MADLVCRTLNRFNCFLKYKDTARAGGVAQGRALALRVERPGFNPQH